MYLPDPEYLRPVPARIDWVNVAVWLTAFIMGAGFWLLIGVMFFNITDPAVLQ